jgi:hypothetical protein
MTNYHVHLTVPPDAPIPKGWKRTTILLEGAKVQTDVSSVEDIKADIASLHLDGIVRVKIEQDDAFTLPITPTNYMEIHMLCPTGVVPKGDGWVKSSNPRKNTPQGPVYFYNKRVYNSPLTAEEFSNATLEEQDVSYTECKIEQVIYDSNREHDSWWA